MELVEERPIDDVPAEPLHCVCRRLASVRTHCVVALFRDPSPLAANGLFSGRGVTQASCALPTGHLGNREFRRVSQDIDTCRLTKL